MLDPESAFDLRKFPRDQHERFVDSVTRGKNQMPPWGDMLKADEIEALWAYVPDGRAAVGWVRAGCGIVNRTAGDPREPNIGTAPAMPTRPAEATRPRGIPCNSSKRTAPAFPRSGSAS